jgi:hypothetical protein
MRSRSSPGRAASSTSTSTVISSSRRRCWATTRSPTTSCRSSASASPDLGRRLHLDQEERRNERTKAGRPASARAGPSVLGVAQHLLGDMLGGPAAGALVR